MIPDFLVISDQLPVGRYSADLKEFHRYFVENPNFADSSTRVAIWNDFQQSLDVLRSAVSVASVWIGGSFSSGKLNPSDIDCLFVVDERELKDLDANSLEGKILQEFATSGSLKSQGLRVDNFFLVWRPVINPAGRSPEEQGYYSSRGHWDDWWQRTRSENGDALESTVPRRGYLEVIIDGIAKR